ncbi:MAG: hypothetical protein G01um101413_213 [Parcubacteria group bacterium Gr01-1014_13]|nr:MAG: hypothetical protein G01um101413_213 [Parcubacteria group bacterium Gr01-1014_13]
MDFISKTTYLEYLSCGKNAWLRCYKPELKSLFKLSDFDKSLVDKGNLVEDWARKLFPDGVLITESDEEALRITKQHIADKTHVIFQSKFIHDKFLAKNDVLEYDKFNDCWNLYEIKGTNTLDENVKEIDHIEDATFQTIILKAVGIKVGKVFIIHLNKEYVREEEINVEELFIKDDITEEVKNREENTKEKMQKAAECLFQQNEQALVCQCVYSGRSAHCATFNYSYPNIPEYSVHDLSRIGNSKKKLESLVDSQIFDINEIPEDFELTPNQQNQVYVHKTQKPIVDLVAIKKELKSLAYPLYFLDYETYPPAIPLFKGFKPYQQIPFQFSLHIIDDEDSEPIHLEYLHENATDPSLSIILKLKEMIGPNGNIITWNKRFEKGINTQLAERNPEYADFIEDINSRIYDLMEIFQKQFYVHPGFKGKVSIKKVLPILVPKLSYKELEIKEGGSAMEAWYEMVFGSGSQADKNKIADDLRKYCGLDTYAMYAIWKELMKIVWQ